MTISKWLYFRAVKRKIALCKKINDLRGQLNELWVEDPNLFKQPNHDLKRTCRILTRKVSGKYMNYDRKGAMN